MKRTSLWLVTLLVGTFTADAHAAEWADFGSAFPAFPCQDGWMGCKVNGKSIGPDLQSGTDAPLMADARVDWFSLTPTDGFSPFVGLSEYTGELPPAAPEPAPAPPPMPDPEPVAAAPAPSGGGMAPAPAPSAAPAPMTRPEPAGGGMVRPEPAGGGMVRPEPTAMARPEPAAAPEPAGGGMVRPPDAPAPVAAPAPTAALVAPAPTTSIQVAAQPAAPAAAQDDGCSNLLKLEPPAMMGQLRAGQVQCLESSYSAAASQTDKDRISRLLMSNSYSKGDKRSWEKLVKRHLDEVDQSDPNICYKYASHLSKKGPGRAQSVIRWSEVALENRSAWKGSTHVSRVYALYKLRAVAAKGLWEKAEGDFVASPGDETKKRKEQSRNTTKVYAREWYEYAKVAKKDVTQALQLCTSAAGTKDYCEAG
jgi:hypothetical protein